MHDLNLSVQGVPKKPGKRGPGLPVILAAGQARAKPVKQPRLRFFAVIDSDIQASNSPWRMDAQEVYSRPGRSAIEEAVSS
jgi:hypothetical protein